MYFGRVDNQIKIQGFRVELSEIEHHVRVFTNINHVKAISTNSSRDGYTQINLFLENYSGNTSDVIEYLSTKIPKYMIPNRIFVIPLIPLNSNGKVDKNALIKMTE
jgi:D-alanine--poly(phosphoribitol) ligase subunit 1